MGLVPYLLGFLPEESLVLLLLRDGRVHLTARIDLVASGAADAVTAQFTQLANQADAAAMVLFAYSDNTDQVRQLMPLLVRGLAPRGLVDAIHADGQRWWSFTRTADAGCCPPEGTPYDLTSHPMAAEAVFAGLTAAPGRADIAALVAGPAAAEVGPLDEVFEQVGRELSELEAADRAEVMFDAVNAFVSDPRRLADAECARFALLAFDVSVRDVAWSLIDRLDIDDHLDLWSQVVARAIAPYQPAVLCLLGMAAWVSGNGALQNCCSERVRQLDPSYTMAALLEDINRRALPPAVWELMAGGLRDLVGPLAG